MLCSLILVFPLQGIEKKKSIKPDANKELEEFRHLMARVEESNIKVPEDLDIDDVIDEMNFQEIPSIHGNGN